MAVKNNVPTPPLTVGMLDSTGRISKPWAQFMTQFYTYLAKKGNNAITGLDGGVEQNTADIEDNTQAIAANTSSIEDQTSSIAAVVQSLSDHINADSAHGANGDVVGKNDEASNAELGLVKKITLVADAIDSSILVTGTATTAGATYNQTQANTVVDLANECKADINTLKNDLNNAITQFNELLTKSKTAKQMDTS